MKIYDFVGVYSHVKEDRVRCVGKLITPDGSRNLDITSYSLERVKSLIEKKLPEEYTVKYSLYQTAHSPTYEEEHEILEEPNSPLVRDIVDRYLEFMDYLTHDRELLSDSQGNFYRIDGASLDEPCQLVGDGYVVQIRQYMLFGEGFVKYPYFQIPSIK